MNDYNTIQISVLHFKTYILECTDKNSLNIFKYQKSEFEGIYLIENLKHVRHQKKVGGGGKIDSF